MPPLSNRERQQRQLARERAAGIIRKLVRIPAKREAALESIVAEWMAVKEEEDKEAEMRKTHVAPAPDQFNAWLVDTDDHLPDDFEHPV